MAAWGVAGLRHERSEFRDKRILFLRLRPAQFVDHLVGAFGDGLVAVSAEAVDADRPERGEVHLACWMASSSAMSDQSARLKSWFKAASCNSGGREGSAWTRIFPTLGSFKLPSDFDDPPLE